VLDSRLASDPITLCWQWGLGELSFRWLSNKFAQIVRKRHFRWISGACTMRHASKTASPHSSTIVVYRARSDGALSMRGRSTRN
jgi:hypothetical protein